MKVALYKASAGTLVDKGIDMWTGFYGYSHCELVFDQISPPNDGKYLTCSSSPRDGDVRFASIDIYSGHWHVIDLDVDLDTELEAYDMLQEMIGAKYDWKGIFFWFIFGFVKKQDEDKWWCSEICAFILDYFDIIPLEWRIDPNEFARILKAPKQKFSFKFSWKKIIN